MFTPGQLRPLLEALSRSDAVIVGGQAVNLWSELYGRDEEPWRSLHPFTSRDLDALASAAALLDCARQTANPATHPILVRWAQRLRSLANDQLGLEAAQVHAIDYRGAIPAALWQGTPGPLAEFMAAEWEAWGSEVRRR